MKLRLALASLLLLPSLAQAASQTIRCHAPHFARIPMSLPADPQESREIRFTTIYVNNGDLENEAVVERLTWRDEFGATIFESVLADHPAPSNPQLANLNDPIPPGGTTALTTRDILNATPPGADPVFPNGTARSLTIEVSKRGKRSLLVVHAREVSREDLAAGVERSATNAPCFRVDAE